MGLFSQGYDIAIVSYRDIIPKIYNRVLNVLRTYYVNGTGNLIFRPLYCIKQLTNTSWWLTTPHSYGIHSISFQAGPTSISLRCNQEEPSVTTVGSLRSQVKVCSHIGGVYDGSIDNQFNWRTMNSC